MHVVVTGGTGLIGRALIPALLARGDRVTVFTRSPERARRLLGPGVHPLRWPERDPAAPWQGVLRAADAVVHLAGATLNARWTPAYKKAIVASRVETTEQLVSALCESDRRPHTLVSGSAIGYYGAGEDWVDESSPAGGDFLAGVCRAWEQAAAPAVGAGIRTVLLRTGVVLTPEGGALAKMLPAFRLFVGGPLGTGRQWVSWIHIADLVRLIVFALDRDELSGPLNGTAPEPVRMAEFACEVGRVLRRPSLLRVPAFALRLLLGEMATVVLTGQRVRPSAALNAGFDFTHPTLPGALQDLLRR